MNTAHVLILFSNGHFNRISWTPTSAFPKAEAPATQEAVKLSSVGCWSKLLSKGKIKLQNLNCYEKTTLNYEHSIKQKKYFTDINKIH
jgi:hypothetical protein